MYIKYYKPITNIAIKYWLKYKMFFLYCLIGVSGVTIDFLLFTLLTKKIGIFYQFANAISVTLGIINNFFLNVFLNFRKYDKLFLRFLSFYTIGMIGLGISAGILFILIKQLHCNFMISKIITIFIVTLCQFGLNKTISFKTYIEGEKK